MDGAELHMVGPMIKAKCVETGRPLFQLLTVLKRKSIGESLLMIFAQATDKMVNRLSTEDLLIENQSPIDFCASNDSN
jgi:hypothetical protein